MSDSTRKRRPRKDANAKAPVRPNRPKKPYPDFPLSPHPSGAWQKKIRGKIHYFGRWAKREGGKLVRIDGDGWKEALEQYKAVADDLHAGRTPCVKSDGLTVAELCNRFLTAKLRKRESGELGARMFVEYRETTDLIVSAFGKTRLVDDLAAGDFESLRATMAERWGPTRLGNGIQKVRTVFKYAQDNVLIDKPVRFGSEFKKPDKAVLRRQRADSGKKMMEASDLRRLIDAADVPMRAMILLGLNAGFGNNDLSTLPFTALDLERGWVDFPRPKTGIERRCPLWPETVAALRAVLSSRPVAKDQADADLVFLQRSGRRWVRNTEKSRTDNVAVVFCQLLKECGLYRDGHGFYDLRHTFRTVADAARDPVAIDLIMGHTDPTMGGHYRERIDDSRLRAVAEYVRSWLFGDTPDGGNESDDDTPDNPPTGEGEPDRTSPENCSGSSGGSGASEGDERPSLRLFAG